jgi:hypothetical protein
MIGVGVLLPLEGCLRTVGPPEPSHEG